VSGRKIGVGALVVRYAARLRFPYLFLATLTALFGTWRRRRVSGSKNLAPDGGVAGPYDRQESD
jgi:hypothetical protein